MSKILSQLLSRIKAVSITGATDKEISSIESDSRKITPGALFVAVPGVTVDGHKFIPDVVKAGATAVVCQTLPDVLDSDVTYIKVECCASALGFLASEWYDNPTDKLKLVGVTGTNGKTTTATLLYEMLRMMGYKTGLFSTVCNYVDGRAVPATQTTPDQLTLNRLMHEMVEEGCEYAFMEVSSHAADQHRIDGLRFRGAIFTNLTRDHLDYHKTVDAYMRAKKRFFDILPADAFALVNADDKAGQFMLQNTAAKKYTYSLRSQADFRCKIIESRLNGTLLNIDRHEVEVLFTGRFNAYNLLAVYGATRLLGFDEDMIHTRYPADVLVSMEDPNHMIDMDTFLTDELKSVPGGSYTSYEFLTGYDSTEETEDHSSAIFMKDGTAQVDSITRNVLFFSAETYNRITGENVTVEPGTALYMSVDGVPMPDTMTFAGTTYALLPTPKSFNLRGRYHAYVSKPYVVVLPDYAEKSQVITPTEYYCISLGKLTDEEQQTFYDAILEDVTTIMPDEENVFWDEDGYFNFECRAENTKEIRSMYGSFLFMGISLGFVFTMAAVLIIYYKQISEGMEDKNRFAIMQQVGLSQKEVKHSIHTQILTVFFLPLITAGIHVMFAYPIIRAILRAMMLSSETVFITCTVASFLVFSVLYAVVYALTAKVYYRIISEDNK